LWVHYSGVTEEIGESVIVGVRVIVGVLDGHKVTVGLGVAVDIERVALAYIGILVSGIFFCSPEQLPKI
jgi:hypothetical protein